MQGIPTMQGVRLPLPTTFVALLLHEGSPRYRVLCGVAARNRHELCRQLVSPPHLVCEFCKLGYLWRVHRSAKPTFEAASRRQVRLDVPICMQVQGSREWNFSRCGFQLIVRGRERGDWGGRGGIRDLAADGGGGDKMPT